MTVIDLPTQLIFVGLLLFCRVGTILMFFPGIGDLLISPMIRLIFAILFTILLVPIYANSFPAYPSETITLVSFLALEITLGLILGILIRIMLSTLHALGLIISFQSGLSTVVLFDPTQATQGSFFGNFLTILTIVIFLATDGHHTFLKAIAYSYDKFPLFSYTTYFSDFKEMIVRAVNDSFQVAIRLSAPFLLLGLIGYIVGGILSRLMPHLQIFFVMLPAQILLISSLFLMILSSITYWFLEYYQEYILDIFTS